MALSKIQSDSLGPNAVVTSVLSDSGVTAGSYGNTTAIPVITVDAKGRITSATTNSVSGVTGVSFTSANNTVTVSTSTTDFSANITASLNTTYSNATSYADTKAATAYSNGVTYSDTIAATAYSNAVSTASADATTKAATAYTNAVAYAASNSYVNTTFAPKAGPTFTGTAAFADVTISGNLTTSGTTTYVNTTNLNIGDNLIVLNADLGATAPTEDAGIVINRGSSANVQFNWDETNDRWALGNTYITGYANVSGSLNVGTSLIVGTTISANGSTGGPSQVLMQGITGNTYWSDELPSVTQSGAIPMKATLGWVGSNTNASSLWMNFVSNTLHSNSNLNVAGNTTITGYANVSTSLQVGTNTATFGTAVYIAANGSVSIGTANTYQKLTIKGRFNSDLNDSYYGAWGEGNSASGGYSFLSVGEWYNASAYWLKKTGQGYSHIYLYSNTHNLVLQAGSGSTGETAGSGNVGIGNTSPSHKLSVNGTAYFNSNVSVAAAATSNVFYVDNSLADVTPSLLMDFVNGKTIDPKVTFQRGSSATVINARGKLQVVGAGVPRFDHDILTGVCKGLLMEEQRTNYVLYSDCITGTSVGSNATDLGSVAGPDGSTGTARRIRFNAPSNSWLSVQYNVPASGTYVFSIWVRLNAGTAPSSRYGYFNAAGLSVQMNATPTSAWQRVYGTCTFSGSSTGTMSLPYYDAPTGTELDYAWAQLELGSFPTSLIPTTGSAATRSVDQLYSQSSQFSSFWNPIEGTIYSEARQVYNPGGASYPGHYNISNGTVNYRFTIGTRPGDLNLFVSSLYNGTSFLNNDGGFGASDRSIQAYPDVRNGSANAYVMSQGGSVVRSSISAHPGANVTQMFLGLADGRLNGHLKKFAYYPKYLSESQSLEIIT